MKIQGLYAVACVTDMARAEDWYTALLARPADDHPMPTLTQWRNIGTAGIQLILDADKAGQSVLTIVTPDIEWERDRLADLGVDIDPISRGGFGAIAEISDQDGNRIIIAEPPKGFTG
ncbi:VOC family protein [Sphingomonas sp. 22R3R2A-7]|uniref:VOC family protein n=1 Tax=Sphingomonas sp. 22R3R2A-7 TaxID=3050230 RepID=UPI002FE1E27C